MSDGCAMVETVVRGIREASLTMFIKSTDAANLITELTAENAKLRACLGDGCADCAIGMGEYADSLCDPLKVENAKLRELLHDAAIELYVNGNITDGATELLFDKMRELGIETE